MENQKLENVFSLSLAVSEKERERSAFLSAGYDEETREWELIVKKFSVKTTTTFNSSFLDFLREKGLHPKPFDEEKGQWVANCPSGAKHPIMINAYFDEFGCGWCKKKGGKQELKDWIQEINLEK